MAQRAGAYIYLYTPQAACSWSSHTGKYSGGHAGGVSTGFSIQDAKSKCIELGADTCKAITCNTGGVCTVRASSFLRTSPSGETTYAPTTKCFQASAQYVIVDESTDGGPFASCMSAGHVDIASKSECENAAAELGLAAQTALDHSDTALPSKCFTDGKLFWNGVAAATGKEVCGQYARPCICKKSATQASVRI